MAYATAILGDYHLAEDAAQEAFVDAYRALRSLREPAAFGWLRSRCRGHEAFVRLLLRHQPDLAARVTVAHPPAMAKLLFQHGMDANHPDWLRKTRLLDEYERSGVLPERRLSSYEALAADLVNAYGPGDAAALQRLIEYFGATRPLTWDRPSPDVLVSRVRKAVLQRLGDRRSAGTTEASLAPDDARWLVARREGFEDWDELVADVEPFPG